jgi:hypothetical protein
MAYVTIPAQENIEYVVNGYSYLTTYFYYFYYPEYLSYDPFDFNFWGANCSTYMPNVSCIGYGPPLLLANIIELSVAAVSKTTTTCSFPSGELSTYFDWMPGNQPFYMALFFATLQTNPWKSFDGRIVYEDLTKGSPFDTCKDQWGSNSPYPAWNTQEGIVSSANVGVLNYPSGLYYGPYHNGYGFDKIGWPDDLAASVAWYQNQMRNGYPVQSCGWLINQHMFMNGCSPNQASKYYEPGHSMYGWITKDNVTIYRATASAAR